VFGANLISALNTYIHPRKEAIIVEGSLILVLSVSRLNIDLDQLENGATPQFTPMATSKWFFFFFFFFKKFLFFKFFFSHGSA
jgi:hypothetical protein